ncbi:MAG: STAS/SEC14 domain-containing protein [Campylobacteraceae bacterium 4484_4]|nr:MAG: STAS/SEC14 domain-containing protein [Campylobacteraceae bacterium 4484_4]
MKIKIEEHGISVAVNRSADQLFIELKMIGKLTHEDYQTFVPILEKALKEAQNLRVNMLVDMTAFKSWKLRAAWDDMVFGLKHRGDFNKMAIVGKKKWEEVATAMMQPLMKGKVKFFKKRQKALEWLLNDKK